MIYSASTKIHPEKASVTSDGDFESSHKDRRWDLATSNLLFSVLRPAGARRSEVMFTLYFYTEGLKMRFWIRSFG